eukprot:13917071-Alexandrium_andersonii.AAC.1
MNLVYSMVDEATRFHVAEIVQNQRGQTLYEAINRAWIRWAGAPKFIIVDPHKAQVSRTFVSCLGAHGTTVLCGAAEASWTRGLVEKHGDYLRHMANRMADEGLPSSLPAQAVLTAAASSKNAMSRIRGFSPNQW